MPAEQSRDLVDSRKNAMFWPSLALVAKMTADERHEFMAELKEQYPSAGWAEGYDSQPAEKTATMN
jgi:hypothetical protein